MNIFLMGYRGSGKSSVGRVLAEKLGLELVDTDARVVERFGGKPIAQIWQDHGEAAFREMEVQVARELVAGDGRVVALGGGTPVQPGARQSLAEAGGALRIYLQAPPEVLYQRIVGDAATADARPSLTQLGGGLHEVQRVLAERDPIYRELADAVVDVSQQSVEAVAQAIEAIAKR